MRRLSTALAAVSAALLSASTVGAQTPAPGVSVSPATGTFAAGPVTVTITWCGHTTLSFGSQVVEFNGADVTANFSYNSTTVSGCYRAAQSVGTVTLIPGRNSLDARIDDTAGQTGYGGGVYTVASPSEGVVMSLAPQNGTNHDVSLCVADCFDQVVTYSTPSYRSLDQDRALTLVYRSSQAAPIGAVTVDIRDTAAGKTVSKFGFSILGAGNVPVTQRNGAQETFFTNQAGQTVRIVAQFDASGLSTGSYAYTAAVKSYYEDGSSRTTARTVRVLVINERSSPYGAGWNVAGLQHVYPEIGGSGVTVTDGDGSAQYFAGPCVTTTCTYVSPAADFSTMNRLSTGAWTRRYPDGTVVNFNTSGYETSLSDRFGNTTSYQYSGSRLSSITDPVGQGITLGSVAGGYTVSVPLNRMSWVTLDGSNRVTNIQDPVGGHPITVAAFDGTGYRIAQWTDRRQGTWNATFDCAGYLSVLTEPTVVANNTSMRPYIQATHPDVTTSTCYQSVSPIPSHLASDFLGATIDARAFITWYRLDAFLAPIQIYDPLNRVTTITRDSASHVLSVVTPSGHMVTNTWNGPNLVQVADNTTGRTISYHYDARYNLVDSVYGHLPKVVNYLNASGTLVDSTRVATGPVTKLQYDGRGRPTLTTDPEGHRIQITFGNDSWSNTRAITVGGTHTTSFTFDDAGRVTQTTDALNHTMQTVYDPLNRVQLAIGPRADTTTYVYDSLYLWKVIDARHQTYQYDRNALGWTTTYTDPTLTNHIIYAYDANGNPVSTTNRRGQTDSSTYDPLNRPVALIVPANPERTTTFSYDPTDRWMTAVNAASADTIQFDVAGRVVMEIARQLGQRLLDSSAYDNLVGARVMVSQLNVPGSAVQYGYDANYQLASLNGPGGQTNVGYNGDRMSAGFTYPSAVSKGQGYSATHQQGVTWYNPAGAIESAFHVGMQQDYTGRIAERHGGTDPDTVRVFTYDEAGQLTNWHDEQRLNYSCAVDPEIGTRCIPQSSPPPTYLRGETYSYDAVGNRTEGGDPVDAGNRIRSFHGFALTYDPDGNLTSKVKAGVTNDSFVWNALGELTQVTHNGAVTSFAYDGFGRRVTKTTSAGTINYQWDGDNVVQESSGGTSLAQYMFYPGVDEPYGVTTGAGTFIMATESQGNVLGLFPSTSNSVAAQYRYLPFGTMERNDQTVTNSLRFQARPYDSETGLYYFRARYYDPDLARFISEDPIGISGGINPYVFAGNNPISGTDPSGMDGCRPDAPSGWTTYTDQGGKEWCAPSLPPISVTAPATPNIPIIYLPAMPPGQVPTGVPGAIGGGGRFGADATSVASPEARARARNTSSYQACIVGQTLSSAYQGARAGAVLGAYRGITVVGPAFAATGGTLGAVTVGVPSFGAATAAGWASGAIIGYAGGVIYSTVQGAVVTAFTDAVLQGVVFGAIDCR